MTDESSVPAKEAVNRLVNAFRKELDSYVQQLDEQEATTATSSSRGTTSRVANGRYNTTAESSSSTRKRVVLDETPRHRDDDDLQDAAPPPPIQTPYRDNVSPPSATSRTSAATTPAAAPQPPALFSAAHWKANMNEIADLIETSEARVTELQRDKEELEHKVDVLTRDYAILQEDYQQMQTRKVKGLTEENEVLKEVVEEVRAAALDEKQASHAELTELRALLREARTERDTVERQNDRLYDRIRDYEQRFGTLGMSPVRPRQGGASVSYQQQQQQQDQSLRSTSSLRGSSSYRTTTTTANRGAASPGEALVRDLSEKTFLDADYLAPLSDILDRRLGRTPATKTSFSRTPSRNLYS